MKLRNMLANLKSVNRIVVLRFKLCIMMADFCLFVPVSGAKGHDFKGKGGMSQKS